MTPDLPETGVIQGLSARDYFAIDAINASLLKEFDGKTPLHARYNILHPSESTPSQAVGSAVHCSVLEPERFAMEYVAAPKFDRRTKEGKAGWRIFEENNADKERLTADEFDHAEAISKSVHNHQTAAEFLKSKGANEVTLVWRDAEFGVLNKARVDALRSWSAYPTLGDIKTTQDASPSEFARSVHKFGYHIQAAHYLDGIETLKPLKSGNWRFLFIAVENKPPYAVCVYELDEASIREGQACRREHMKQLLECKSSNNWPGYPGGVQSLRLSKWAFRFTQGV